MEAIFLTPDSSEAVSKIIAAKGTPALLQEQISIDFPTSHPANAFPSHIE